ncbi:hypothetical protein SmJEL517_g00586 [Synchytrium microbalum]|uniref:Uncharacterized protein n=1 Tax=Synchytrium microbalum TaxID=1806994 RepID=A0A507CID0_9FUNG|nr:uncharacterized protein SmJEL517_g00586 [Synchytrium microbalum]TPX37455.1 hypothetical protein SmJEL517_g00586 [Synchytrium microbalum]
MEGAPRSRPQYARPLPVIPHEQQVPSPSNSSNMWNQQNQGYQNQPYQHQQPQTPVYDQQYSKRSIGGLVSPEGMPHGYLKRSPDDAPSGLPLQKRLRNASTGSLPLGQGSNDLISSSDDRNYRPVFATPRIMPPPAPQTPSSSVHHNSTPTTPSLLPPPPPLQQHTPNMPTMEDVQRLRQENEALREQVTKLQSQTAGMSRQQTTAIMRLAKKEEEIQSLYTEMQDLSHRVHPELDASKQRLLDPVLHLLFQEMKKEIDEKNNKIDDLTQELQAAQFSPHNLIGRKLIAKCKALQGENEELGRQLAFGRVEQLQVALALEKRANGELKKSLEESDLLLASLDAEMEGMQDSILGLRTKVAWCEKTHGEPTTKEEADGDERRKTRHDRT